MAFDSNGFYNKVINAPIRWKRRKKEREEYTKINNKQMIEEK